MEVDFARAQVTLVGLGLMGGSLAAALSARRACRRIVGVARRPTTLETARMMRFIDYGTDDLAEGVAEADLVVLCTPVRDILTKIAALGPLLKPGAVLMDVGSTKVEICRAMEQLPESVQPLGAHPMCGKEASGLTVAEPDLYQDRVFVLVPLERTAPWALEMGQRLTAAVGARALVLDAERHDEIVAAISHLPYLLAVTLVNAAVEVSDPDGLTWRLAAGGFRDTSRVAAGSIVMMMDILTSNRGPILEALRAAQGELARLTELLEDKDWETLQGRLEAARQQRREVF